MKEGERGRDREGETASNGQLLLGLTTTAFLRGWRAPLASHLRLTTANLPPRLWSSITRR